MFASKPRYAPSATEVKNEFEWPLKGYWPAWDVLLRMPEEGYGPLGRYCPDEWELPFTIWEMKALAPGADDVRQTKSAHFGFKVPGRLFLCRRGFFCCCTSVCTSLWNRVSTLFSSGFLLSATMGRTRRARQRHSLLFNLGSGSKDSSSISQRN